MELINADSIKTNMRKGILEFAVLATIAGGKVYASDILQSLKRADLLVVEGTLYPLMSRLRREGLVSYEWEESVTGPPRKYYTLTKKGRATLTHMDAAWQSLSKSITTIRKHYA